MSDVGRGIAQPPSPSVGPHRSYDHPVTGDAWGRWSLAAAMLTVAVGTGVPRAVPASASERAPGAPYTVRLKAPGPYLNPDLIGVNQLSPGASARLASVGVRWARIDISFEATDGGRPVTDCATGRFDPALLDRRVALARQAGATPELLIDYTPPCLAGGARPGTDPAYTPPDVGANRQTWDRIVASMASHEIGRGVRTFEIWNEPDGLFWTGDRNAYLDLYQDTAQVLESEASRAHVRIEVGGPALVVADTDWADAVAARVTSARLPLDFLSWHIYPNDPDVGPFAGIPSGLCIVTGPRPADTPCWYNPRLTTSVVTTGTDSIRAVLARYPGLHPRLWIDEWNLDAGHDARQDTAYEGAFDVAMLEAAWHAGVDRTCFFRVADGSTQDLKGNWGLLTESLRPKAAWWAFSWWHALSGSSRPVGVRNASPSTSSPSSLSGVAAVDRSGTIRVLLDDYVPYDPTGRYGTGAPTHPRRVAFDPLPTGPWEYSVRSVDSAHLGAVTARGALAGGRAGSSVVVRQSDDSLLLVTLTRGAPRSDDVAVAGIVAGAAAVAVVIASLAAGVVIGRRRRGPSAS